MCSSMHGTCSICGKVGPLRVTDFRYNIKCACHSPYHVIRIEHCKDCVPVEPRETKVTFRTEDLMKLTPDRK